MKRTKVMILDSAERENRQVRRLETLIDMLSNKDDLKIKQVNRC